MNGVRFDVSAADRRIDGDGNGNGNNSRLRILISESDI